MYGAWLYLSYLWNLEFRGAEMAFGVAMQATSGGWANFSGEGGGGGEGGEGVPDL